MQITITYEQLNEKDACERWLNVFQEEFGESVILEWTQKKQIELIQSKWREVFGWMINNQILPLWSMRRANLGGADLRGADLRWSNLEGANLRGANLRWSNLEGANLEGANLEGANLEGANLEGSLR